MLRRSFVARAAGLLVAQRALPQTAQPLFSFGLLADVQYAEKDAKGVRAYRESLTKLEHCAANLRKERLEFVIQVGDLVDDGLENFDAILRVLRKVGAPQRHVLGNHDFCAPREVVMQRLGMTEAYYHFAARGWRFVVLDGMNVSVSGGWSESHALSLTGREMLDKLRSEGARNAQAWNGAVGPQQREWLKQTLAEATKRNERVIVFCHFPVLLESCRPEHLLWDHGDVLKIIESEPSVVAYINGHDHRGGYAAKSGIHYLTLPGMVEHDAASGCRVMDVYPERLVLRTIENRGSQLLPIRPR